ncbi:MAG: 3-deoxy-manno-octulosonate cytidylyltransferase [Planctomycetes bacterium]|nr:3-deoxy-manno-octulosonate cytidylyltransferase [Planctomycetota bacterium]
MSSGRVVVVLPARYASKRLPAKPLLRETGRYLIQHAWERVRAARLVDEVIVATDDERIADAVRSFGGRAVRTRADHRSGTDRVREAVESIEADLILNVQGDEPEVEPDHIDALVALLAGMHAPYGTLATPLLRYEEYVDRNRVKVVLDAERRALYFSRSPIPNASREEFEAAAGRPDGPFFRHIGLYAYSREFLLRFVAMPPSHLEACERLEQLRAVEAGFPPRVVLVAAAAPGIDTAEDYRAFVERWRRRGEANTEPQSSQRGGVAAKELRTTDFPDCTNSEKHDA